MQVFHQASTNSSHKTAEVLSLYNFQFCERFKLAHDYIVVC